VAPQKKCYMNIKKNFCGNDEDAWRESCKAAFDTATVAWLEHNDWNLTKLDPEQF